MYSEVTYESTRYEIFKGHVDFNPANAQNLSFSLEVTEFSVNRTERWLLAQKCLGVAARESTVTAR